MSALILCSMVTVQDCPILLTHNIWFSYLKIKQFVIFGIWHLHFSGRCIHHKYFSVFLKLGWIVNKNQLFFNEVTSIWRRWDFCIFWLVFFVFDSRRWRYEWVFILCWCHIKDAVDVLTSSSQTFIAFSSLSLSPRISKRLGSLELWIQKTVVYSCAVRIHATKRRLMMAAREFEQ